jgi:hypothetical protein
MSASSKHLFELTGEHEFAVDPLGLDETVAS